MEDISKYFTNTITSFGDKFNTLRTSGEQISKDLKKAQDNVWRLWEGAEDEKLNTLGNLNLLDTTPIGLANKFVDISTEVAKKGGIVEIFNQKQQAVKDLAVQQEQILLDSNRTYQMVGAMNLLVSDDSPTFEKFMSRLPPSDITSEDIQSLQKAFNKKRDYIQQVISQPNMTNVDQLTVHEINKAGEWQVRRTPLAKGNLSPTNVESEFGKTNDELMKENDELIIQQMTDFNATIKAITEAQKDLKVKDLSVMEIAWMVLNQPALATLDLADFINENYGKPISGGQVALISAVGSTIKGETENKFSKAIRKAQAEGKDDWHSAAAVYDIEDEGDWNWFTKMAANIVLDPTVFVGWAGTSRILTQTGVPALKGLATLNNGFISVTDNAAEIITVWKWFKKIPKTPKQFASSVAGHSKDELRAALVQATGQRDITKIPPKQVREIAEAAVQNVIDHPNLADMSHMSSFGKWQMIDRAISKEEVVDLAKSVKMKGEVQTEHIYDIQTAYQKMKIDGKGGGFTLSETVDVVANALGVKNTEENRLLISEYLTNRQKTDLKEIADVFKGDSVPDMLKKFAVRVDDIMYNNLTSDVAQFAARNTKMAKFLSKIDEITTTGAVAALDKHLTVPMARQALVFANFGIPNVLEVIMRGAMRGYNLVPGMVGRGESSVNALKMIAADLSNCPSDIANAVVKVLVAVGDETKGSALRGGADSGVVLEKIFKNVPGVGADISKLPGWIPKIGGKDIPLIKNLPKSFKSQEAWNDLWAEVGTRGYAEYIMKSYAEHLEALAPTEWKAASDWASSLSKAGIKSFDKKDLLELQTIATHYALLGENALKTLTPDITALRKSKLTMEANKVLSNHPTLDSSLRNYISEQMTLGEDIPTFMKNAEGILKDSELFNIVSSASLYDEMAKSFAKWPITSTQDLDMLMFTLGHAVENNWKNISKYRSMTTRRAQDFKDVILKDDLQLNSLKLLEKYMDSVNASLDEWIKSAGKNLDNTSSESGVPPEIQNVVDKIKSGAKDWTPEELQIQANNKGVIEDILAGKAVPTIDNSKLDTARNLLSIHAKRLALNKDARLRTAEAFASTLKEFKVPPGGRRPTGDKADAFWKSYHSKANKIWDEINNPVDGKDFLLKKDYDLATMDMGPAPKALPKFQGDLLISHIAYIFNRSGDSLVSSMVDGATGHFMERDEFITSVLAKASAIAEKAGGDAATSGFTKESVSKCYDDVCRAMNSNPDTVNVLTPKLQELQDIRIGLEYVKAGSSIDPDDVAKFQKWLSEAPKNVLNKDTRTQAMENARLEYTKDFPDYTVQNAATAILKKIYPFFTYESQRWPWVARQVLSKPAILNSYNQYMDNTDGGYIPLGNSDYEFNFLTGSVWSGGMRRLFTRDYPEYSDRFPVLSSINDWVSKRGYYPGAWYNMLDMVFGAAEPSARPQLGEVLPPWMTTGLAALNVALPDNPDVRKVTDFILPDRFKSNLNGKWLASHGYDAQAILAKMGLGTKLSDEEQKQWNMASAATGFFMVANTQLGSMVRYKPKKLRDAYDAAARLIEMKRPELTPERQEWITQHADITGKTVAYYAQLDQLDNQQIQELSGLKDYTKLSTALLPSAQQRVVNLMTLYKHESEDIDKIAKDGGVDDLISFSKQDDMLKAWCRGDISKNGLSPNDWERNNSDLKSAVWAKKDTLRKSETYRDTPLTFDAKTEFYKKTGVPMFTTPIDELVGMYFDVELKKDPLTGENLWNQYYKEREDILDAIPEEDYGRVLQIITKNMTPIQKLQWGINRDYINDFYRVEDTVLTSYPIDQQQKIKAALNLTTSEKKEIAAAKATDVAQVKTTVDTLIETGNQSITKKRFELDRDIARLQSEYDTKETQWRLKVNEAKGADKDIARDQRDNELASLKAGIREAKITKADTIKLMQDNLKTESSNKRVSLLTASSEDTKTVFEIQDRLDAASKTWTAKINAVKLPDKDAMLTLSDEALEKLRKKAESDKDDLREQRDKELDAIRQELSDAKGGILTVYNRKVDEEKVKLRLTDPMLDAWTIFWGNASKPASKDVEKTVNKLLEEIKYNIGNDNFQQYITPYRQKAISKPMPVEK